MNREDCLLLLRFKGSYIQSPLISNAADVPTGGNVGLRRRVQPVRLAIKVSRVELHLGKGCRLNYMGTGSRSFVGPGHEDQVVSAGGAISVGALSSRGGNR